MSAAALGFTAILLGSLAFFEPCTVAGHALFMESSAREGRRRCWTVAAEVWLIRVVLLAGLLLAVVYVLPPLSLSKPGAGLVLALMGTLYLVSRRHDLPVPHLAFHRLVPGSKRWPRAVQLGLTLPACTLPLLVVLAGLVAWLHQPQVALAGGVLFGTFFTLPMLAISLHGLGPRARHWLARTAVVMPHVTAVLFFTTAVLLLWPTLEAQAGRLDSVLQQADWVGLGVSFVAGLVFSFNPVSFAAIPVVLAYVTRAGDARHAMGLGLAFISGLLVTHALLGWVAALGGDWVAGVMGRAWGAVLGPVLVLLGLMWAGLLRLRLPWFGMRARRVRGAWGAFLLAAPFSVAVCPFCAPALLVAVTASAAIGSPLYGTALLLSFALGRSLPILVGAWSMAQLESMSGFSRYHSWFERLGGAVLVLTGLYLLNSYFYWVNLGFM